ncbi:MAG: SprT family zinc-dependent metalloprotease [Pseudomonadota bacterium]
MILRVLPDGQAELVMPRGGRAAEADAFLLANQDWLIEEQHRILSVGAQRPVMLDLQGVGEQWRLDVREQPLRARPDRLLHGDAPDRFVLQVFASDDDDEHVRKRVRARLIERARAMFDDVLPPLASRMASRFERIQVRAQRTRWGSYSASGTISLNYAVIFMPPAVVHYLCVHELAHYHHMNHGVGFWKLVERHAPGARRLDRELTRLQSTIPRWLLAIS